MNWATWHQIGKHIRGDVTESENHESDMNAATEFMSQLSGLAPEEKQKRIVSRVTKEFGSVGRLSLCSLDLLDTPCDVLMCVVHACMIDDGHCVCIGKDERETGIGEWPEIFPRGWVDKNSSFPVYSFKYKCSNNKIAVLKGALMGTQLLVSCVVVGDVSEFMARAELSIKDFVAGSIIEHQEIPSYMTRSSVVQLAKVLKDQILNPLYRQIGISQRTTATTSTNTSTNNRIRTDVPNPGYNPTHPGYNPTHPGYNPGYGGGGGLFGDDLTPGGGLGGGMLFGPGHSSFGRLPGRGAPRFDPYGPPLLPGSFEPPPDHLRPPDNDGPFL